MAEATTAKRRYIAVRLTDEELAMMREVAARLHTRSIDLQQWPYASVSMLRCKTWLEGY
jgi:hypothetical protein